MSTIIYLYCESHTPHISSDEVGHNTGDLPDIRSCIRNRDEIVASIRTAFRLDLNMYDGKYRNIHWFLYHHPKCVLRIEDEYGHVYSLDGDDDTSVAGPCDHKCTPTPQNTLPSSKHYLDCPVWGFTPRSLNV